MGVQCANSADLQVHPNSELKPLYDARRFIFHLMYNQIGLALVGAGDAPRDAGDQIMPRINDSYGGTAAATVQPSMQRKNQPTYCTLKQNTGSSSYGVQCVADQQQGCKATCWPLSVLRVNGHAKHSAHSPLSLAYFPLPLLQPGFSLYRHMS